MPQQTDPENIRDIPDGCVWAMRTGPVKAMLTGVETVAVYPEGRVGLRYVDGTIEYSNRNMDTSRKIPLMVECIEWVQGQRGEK